MIIGIGGVSRSGKTFLSHDVVWFYRQQNLQAIDIRLDDFVKPLNEIPLIKGVTNWEIPASIDFIKLFETVTFLKTKFDVIVLEGHLVYSNEQLQSLLDKKFLLRLEKSTFYKRKENDKRWGEVEKWYVDYIWESFDKYVITDNYIEVSTDYPNIEDIKKYLN